jgi:glucans biosynthesis protein C
MLLSGAMKGPDAVVNEPRCARTATLPRWHSLDAMRAAMMFLGLVLHTATTYCVTPLGEAWPLKDPNTSELFDILLFFIHSFRMPAFFLLAGFFAALLMDRYAAWGFLKNRFVRIVVPLGYLLLTPLLRISNEFALANRRGAPAPWLDARRLLQ